MTSRPKPRRATRRPWRRTAGTANTIANRNRADLDYDGKIMPPPEAVAGSYVAADGKKIKVAPLTDEDKRTLIRWIDLGCPIEVVE